MATNKEWYAVYTKPRAEKKTYQGLTDSGIDAFLPLIKTLKQWSDRKKWVEEPLFRSYLFVRINDSDYYNVLNVVGVVRYITFEGKAVPIPPQQILAIKQYINEEIDHSVNNGLFKIGDRVEISQGALMGLRGNLIEIKGKQRVKVEIEGIGKSILLTTPKSHLKVLK